MERFSEGWSYSESKASCWWAKYEVNDYQFGSRSFEANLRNKHWQATTDTAEEITSKAISSLTNRRAS
ncbi:hypothetical protein KIN20_020456 [Parelaphostrongylus tenuis]|uniref:Uncharacterized protein n=1 Tax=Parelaphostrongylus tenuis TaxID=148309 RepID=A0AAD5MMH2_PARTN|nr:hypothetical protein KIN20_020456 [Parelaphostrongylus tenuis]